MNMCEVVSLSPSGQTIQKTFNLSEVEHIAIICLSLVRYVKTTANATVDHLSKYLALRIALEDRRPENEPEDRGREEAGREEARAEGVGGENGGMAGSGEGTSLSNVSEKQYTIYILTRGGQFSVSDG